MYGIQANFTVQFGSSIHEFPYWDKDSHDEQKPKALAMYEQLKTQFPNDCSLTRLSLADLEEGDFSPTLLRDASKPDYSYEGFSEVWER